MDKTERNRERARRRYWQIKSDPILLKKYRIYTQQNVKKWRENNPEKVKAQRAVFVAIRNKSLKKTSCFCGDEKSQAHHKDYSQPLEVVWLCKKHHMECDGERRELELSTFNPLKLPNK